MPEIPTVYTGKIIELKLNKGPFLAIDMPREPQKAHLSLPIDSIISSFLGKTVKITIQETKITIEEVKEYSSL